MHIIKLHMSLDVILVKCDIAAVIFAAQIVGQILCVHHLSFSRLHSIGRVHCTVTLHITEVLGSIRFEACTASQRQQRHPYYHIFSKIIRYLHRIHMKLTTDQHSINKKERSAHVKYGQLDGVTFCVVR